MTIIAIAKSLGAAALVLALAGSLSGCWPEDDCPEGYYLNYYGDCRADDRSHSIPRSE
ncbi:MAG: hypothetical protein ACR2PJ_00625 [Pseudomonadales bacterium]